MLSFTIALILHLSSRQFIILYGRYHRRLEAIFHLRLSEASGVLRFRMPGPFQGDGSRRLCLVLRGLTRERRTHVYVILVSLHQIVHNLLSEGYRRECRRRDCLRPQHHVVIVFPRQYHQFNIGKGHVVLANIDIVIVRQRSAIRRNAERRVRPNLRFEGDGRTSGGRLLSIFGLNIVELIRVDRPATVDRPLRIREIRSRGGW